MKIVDSNKTTRECESVTLDTNFPGYVRADFVSKIRKGYKHSEWFPLAEFLSNNPAFKKKIAGKTLNQNEDLGVVSKSGKDFITDLSKNWKKDVFKGVPLWISRGKGEGEKRNVVKNNKNTLYIDKPWKTKPDNTSQYVLSFNVAKDIKATGNTLPDADVKGEVGKLIKKAKKSAD